MTLRNWLCCLGGSLSCFLRGMAAPRRWCCGDVLLWALRACPSVVIVEVHCQKCNNTHGTAAPSGECIPSNAIVLLRWWSMSFKSAKLPHTVLCRPLTALAAACQPHCSLLTMGSSESVSFSESSSDSSSDSTSPESLESLAGVLATVGPPAFATAAGQIGSCSILCSCWAFCAVLEEA